MPLRPVDNPPNPYHTSHMEWIDAPPIADLQVFEEEAKSILSENDSPDLGFHFSLNPYRGCQAACAYCLVGDTPILMGDLSTKPLRDIREGDVVYGTQRRGRLRRFTKTSVLAHWKTVKPAWRIRLDDGRELVASADHRFLSTRGWKYVTGAEHGPLQRPHLTANNRLIGIGQFANAPKETTEYKRGYLCGLIRGDGLLGTWRYAREGRRNGDQYQFRLALIDIEPILRAREYLAEVEIQTKQFVFAPAKVNRSRMIGIRTHARANVERIQEIVAWVDEPTDDWCKGFLAGIFDAEGSYSQGVLRISNKDPKILATTLSALHRFGFDCVLEGPRPDGVCCIRVRRGMRERIRFFQTVHPVIARKRTIETVTQKGGNHPRIVSIEPLGLRLPMFDITTGTGDFISNGIVSHNCYARPTHQYLDFGAGTDWERKIIVKVNAHERLREAFMKPSWKGDMVMFSGVTDCYQPLESLYGITRRCLEVCHEFRNPVGIITKGALIRRDLDLLSALHRDARVHVNVSIAFADDDMARKMEPWAPSPSTRFKAVRALADAGIPVGVGVAPIIPGLNDGQIPEILARAKEAGASKAFRVMLRLPAEVKPVFLGRLREEYPDRASKVENAVRDVRGGALYTSEFGERGRGRGPRWDAIEQLFDLACKRAGLDETHRTKAGLEAERGETTFRRPGDQLSLFGK